MIIAIRIKGIVEVPRKVQETLFRMRLRRKYSAILLKNNLENQKLLVTIRNYVAYGSINQETLSLLISKRGVPVKKGKINIEKVVEDLDKLGSAPGIKPFFRLHSPRGGINSKIHFPKGVLGENKEEINQLVRRML